MSSRTLLAELLSQNPAGSFSPALYAEVKSQFAGNAEFLDPTSALLFREDGLRVATVTADNKIVLKKLTLGPDLGS
jgi:hypothetical protein